MDIWQTIRVSKFNRHLHAERYAALVLSGTFEEAGDHGRFQATAGNVVFHDRFEGHLDRFSDGGAVVLNLCLSSVHSCIPGVAKVNDPDFVVRLAENNPQDAVELLLSSATRWTTPPADWPDELAARLMHNPTLNLSRWAEHKGLAPWTVSRGFSQVFGLSPEAFRAHIRSRLALKSIEETQRPLARIASELGFSDQSHMCRSVKQLTGSAPNTWRSAANGFKTNRHPQV